MMLKELARTGVRIPELGMGTSNYRAGPLPLRKALEAGALFIDTAESYGTESVVGEAVKGMRGRVFIASKISPQNFRAADLRKSVDASLLRLGTDRVDLMQLHYPNPSIPIEETMGALAELVEVGKVRYLGVSNFSVAQMEEAQKALGKQPIVSNQVRYNLIDRTIEAGVLPYCQANGITVIAYTPLGRGLDRIRDCDPRGMVDRLVQEIGKSAAQIVLNWCLCKDRVVAIPMSNSVEHLLDNCGASDWRLSSQQLALLDTGIQYRHRTRVDVLARRYLPPRLQALALKTAKWLPRGLRRRFT
jgi:diketogulonate reductase-like aldo/keto reductase